VKSLALSALTSALLFLGACQSTGAQPTDEVGAQVVNVRCPIVPAHEIDPEVSVDWNGQKVAFCCAGCIDKWEALSDADKQAKLTASKD
jgi:hypothetical protein